MTDDEVRLTAELRAANARLAELEEMTTRLRRQVRRARAAEKRLQTQIRRMRHSFSWRVTYPVRALQRVLRSLTR